jgi:hypothetical protein
MRSLTRARLTFAALGCAAALTLAGCASSPAAPPLGGDNASTSASTSPSPSPSTTPSATTAPSPSASPTPTPTKRTGATVTTGSAAKGKAAAAAKKVAQAFVAADNVSTKTGKFTARDKLTSAACTWCRRKKTFVHQIYAGGGHVEGELFTKSTYTITGPRQGVYTVVVNTTVSKYREIDGSGHVTDSHADRHGLLILRIAGSGSASRVVAGIWQPGN